MSMDVSTLAIKVESSGIKEASTALGGLSRSAGTAEKRVESLTDKMTKLWTAGTNTSMTFNGLTGVMGQINTALSSASMHAAKLAQTLGQTAQGMNSLTTQTNQAAAALKNKGYHGGVVVTTLKAMATATLAYFSVRTLKGIVEQADAWGMMQAKLKLATGSMESAKYAQQQLFDMSQKLRTPLEDTIKLYTRLAPAMARMGKSSQDTRDMVEGVALALKLGGSTSAEAASTMLQFSQAANAGRLNGAEFNAVAENGVMILRALEDYLGKNQAELKKMGSEGKLTFDLIGEAMAAALPKMRKDFAELPITFEGAMQRLSNAWFKAVGEIGQEEQIGKRLSEAVLKLEEEIPKIVEMLMKAFSFIIENGKIIAAIFAGLVGMGIAKWALEAVAAFTTITTAVVKAGGAVKVLQLALSFLGGPIGIITGLLTAGGIAWALWGGEGEKAEDKVTKATRLNVDARIKELNREIEKLEARNALAGAKPAESKEPKRSAHAEQQWGDIVALRKRLEGPMDPQVRVAQQFRLNALEREYIALVTAEQRSQKLLADEGEKQRKKKADEYKEDFDKKYGSEKLRADIALKEEREKAVAAGYTLSKEQEKMILAKHMTSVRKEESAALREANSMLERSVTLMSEAKAAYADMLKGEDDGKRSASEKELTVIEGELAKATDKTIKAKLEKARINVLEAIATERQLATAKELKTVEEKYSQDRKDQTKNAEDELRVLQDKINAFGQAKGAVESLTLAQAQNTLEIMKSVPNNQAAIAEQEKLVVTLKKVQEAKQQLGQLELNAQIDEMFDSLKPADFGKDFANAFGTVGAAIDKAGKSLDQYGKKMDKLGDIQKKINKEGIGTKERAKHEEKFRKESLKAELDLYGDMAGAAKGFFKEKTVAYKAFDAIEQGMRAARIAEELKEFAIKQINEKTWLGTKLAALWTWVTADTAATGIETGNSFTKAAASTAAGVAKAFEQLGVWGFAGAAAIVAFMASMGVGSGGGSGGGIDVEERQRKQGTGTVLGDENAKSESIANSLEIMRENSNIGLTYTSEMLVSLRNIDMKMGGLTSSIARVSGMTKGTNFGIQTGEFSGSGLFGSGLFGSKTSRTIQDTGLIFNGLVRDLMGGSGISQYVDVQQTKKKWWGGTSTSNFRETQDVNEMLKTYVGDIFADINSTIITAGVSLGANADYLRTQLEAFAVNTEISLKDLNGEDLEAALNAIFSAAADDMAATVLPAFMQFQRAGEGYFETLTRVATGTERAQDALDSLGVHMIGLSSIVNKSGDIDVELVRDSLIQQEMGTTLADILRLLDGSMEDLVVSYKELTRVRNGMQAIGLGNALTLDLIRGAGGVEALGEAFNEYLDGMFTEQERSVVTMSNLRMEFARLNLTVPASKTAFRELVAGLMAGNAASQELAGRVLALAGDWSEAMDDTESATADARDALSEAYDREAEALENTRDKMQGFADSLKEFRESLTTGDLSTKSAMEKYQTALARYNDVSDRALTGDEKAIEEYQKVAQELLEFSREINASGSGYTADYERVLSETAALEELTGEKASNAELQLEALDAQVEHLLEINESVLTVAQAIANLSSAMGFDPSVVPTTTQAATANPNAALVAEIAALRAEVASLREEQREQTGALIAANFDANEQNAQTVVEGTRQASTDAAYAQRTIGLN